MCGIVAAVAQRDVAPLLVGLGIGENFLGSDAQALIQVTHKMLYLDEGDVVEITRDRVQAFGLDGQPVERAVHVAVLRGTDVDQPRSLAKSVTVNSAGAGRVC
ncbi:hypothetical protein [Rhodanobacter terrae]|uniref:Glutamine--fructose-6-phosphate aminotransferase [isomerizing] n=1 Tax=Rhodanobacter terrae TaxID=418647 RepID=A0ABW0SXS1_9GAMM